MDVEFYKNFVEVVKCGSILAAADNLHIAQSALSNQIKKFEAYYSVDLLERTQRGIKLTEAGKIFYDKAYKITEILDSSYKEVKAWKEGSQGTLNIGTSRSFPDPPTTDLLQLFHREYPQIKYEIYEMVSPDVISNIQAGIIEVGVVRIFGLVPYYLKEEIRMKQRLIAVFREDNPWIRSQSAEIDVNLLHRVPLAIPRGFSKTLDSIFLRADIQPDIISISGRSHAIMWANEGAAVAIVASGENFQTQYDGLICCPLTSKDEAICAEMQINKSIVTLRNRPLSKAAELFVEFSREQLAKNDLNIKTNIPG